MGIGSIFGDVAGGLGRGVLALGTLGISEMGRNQNEAVGQALANARTPQEAISQLGALGTPAAIQLASEIMKNQPAFNPLTPKDVLGAQTQMYSANPLMNAPPDLSGQMQGGQAGQMQGTQQQPQQGMQAQGVGPQQADIGSLVRSGLQGPELLTKLEQVNPGIAATVKSMLTGDKKVSTGMGANSAAAQVYNQLANLVDPDYSDQRYETKQSFLPQGKNGATIASINKVINHTASWMDSMQKLHNSDSNFGAHSYNQLGNYINSFSNAPELKAAETNAEAAGTEVAKALRGVGALNEAEQKAWQDKFSTASTPSEQRAVAAKVFDLLQGQIEPLQEELRRGMGKKADVKQLLHPETLATMQKIQNFAEGQQRQAQGQPQPQAAATKAPPAVGDVVGDYKFLGGNPADKASWAKK